MREDAPARYAFTAAPSLAGESDGHTLGVVANDVSFSIFEHVAKMEKNACIEAAASAGVAGGPTRDILARGAGSSTFAKATRSRRSTQPAGQAFESGSSLSHCNTTCPCVTDAHAAGYVSDKVALTAIKAAAAAFTYKVTSPVGTLRTN